MHATFGKTCINRGHKVMTCFIAYIPTFSYAYVIVTQNKPKLKGKRKTKRSVTHLGHKKKKCSQPEKSEKSENFANDAEASADEGTQFA